MQTRIHQEHCITTAQFVWKCFENWEFHLYKCIHTPVFEVRCVLRQREINWGRRLGNDAITAGYEEHMRRSMADEGRDSLQLRPITNCSSSAEPDEYLHFWKKKKNKCKTYFLSFFLVWVQRLKAIGFRSPGGETAESGYVRGRVFINLVRTFYRSSNRWNSRWSVHNQGPILPLHRLS